MPNTSPAGNIVNVTITGAGLDLNSATPLVNMQPGVGPTIYATSFQPTSDSTVNATFDIPNSATIGDYGMRIGFTDPYTPAVFSVTGPAPVGTISGKIYHDVNENCAQNPTEPDLSGFVVHVTPGDYYAMTGVGGEYNALVPAGTYNLEVLPPTHYSVLCPTGPVSVTLAGGGSVSSGNDFAMDVDSVTDGSISCAAWEFRPGFNTVITVQVRNQGIIPLTGVAQIILDTSLTYISSSPTGTLSGDTLRWDITTPIPAGGIENYQVTVNVPVAVPLGTNILNSTYLMTDSADARLEDNFFDCSHVVIGSYDPNDKTVWDQDMNLADPDIDASDSVLIYRIRFQNTGTASAINIFVRDTIDPLLDPGSLSVIGTSHLPYSMTMNGEGFVEWRFPNIELPDSNSNEPESHGFILFKIKMKPGFSTGMWIRNKAHIYFDFNDPIVTNETSSSIFVSTDDPDIPQLLKVYPNPVSDLLHVELECASSEGIQCRLVDVSGVLVRELHVPCSGGIQQFEFSVDDIGAGVYFLETVVGSQRTTHKVAIVR